MRKKILLQVLALGLYIMGVQGAWGFNSDSILLKDIEVLTLYSGKMTTGKRSSPVPQLQCEKGGTASCDTFRPRVVQCYNRGFDGVDVQWECKTDMDNAYRFGEIEVSCEGYSNRDDPYVLRGSCGLRYTLDYTKEGLNQQRGGHNYYGSDDSSYGGFSSNSHQTYGKSTMSQSSTFADLIVFVAVGLMAYAFYKTCCSGSYRQAGQDAYSTTDDDHPAGGGGRGGGYGWFGGQGGPHDPTAPPQPGFQPGYTDNASCRNRTGNAGGGGGAGGGGFWTGAAAGGLLGYMFGNRGNNYGHYGGYQRPHYGGRSSWFGGGGWNTGGGGGGWSTGGGGYSASSSGTRTASGFGGTSRR